jgi:glucokinase
MIAGYLTARTTDIARVEVQNGKPKILNIQHFNNNEFSDFDSLLSLYIRKNKVEGKSICLGVAGPVIDNNVTATNIPWKLSADKIREKYSFNNVTLVNDLEATAHGLFHLPDDKFFEINKGKRIKNGNIGLLAAGTGLGQGLIYHDGEHYHPYPSEGGHGAFAPANQIEMELWEYLYADLGFVEVEDVLSMDGLVRIYEFMLSENGAEQAEWFFKADDKPSRLIEMALSGKDEIAIKTLELFVDCLASEAANLALKGMTLGGIYLGGVIAPQILPFLDKGKFIDRFVQKGKMSTMLSEIPIGLIIDTNTALIGAGSISFKLADK